MSLTQCRDEPDSRAEDEPRAPVHVSVNGSRSRSARPRIHSTARCVRGSLRLPLTNNHELREILQIGQRLRVLGVDGRERVERSIGHLAGALVRLLG